MSFDKELHKKFYTQLHAFCAQAVVGAYMAVYRTSPDDATCPHKMQALINNPSAILPLLKKYLNDCWASYHKKDDPFIVESIDAILNLGLMTHPSCVFNWIMLTCLEMIKYLIVYSHQYPILHTDLTLLRQILRVVVASGAKEHIRHQLQEKEIIHCDTHCQVYDYKEGEDIVIEFTLS